MLAQDPGARLDRRAGRDHVIHDGNARPAYPRRYRAPRRTPSRREAPPYVSVPARRVDDRQTQLGGQLGRLIEAAGSAAARMEGHWYHTFRVSKDRRAVLTHQLAESHGERVPAVVLQEMDQLPEGPFVWTDGAGPADR